MPEHLADTDAMPRLRRRVLGLDVPAQPFALLDSEPPGVGGFVGQEEQRCESEHDGRKLFGEEHPLPAVQPEMTLEA